MRFLCTYMYTSESRGRSTYDYYTLLIRCKVFVFIAESERVSECVCHYRSEHDYCGRQSCLLLSLRVNVFISAFACGQTLICSLRTV